VFDRSLTVRTAEWSATGRSERRACPTRTVRRVRRQVAKYGRYGHLFGTLRVGEHQRVIDFAKRVSEEELDRVLVANSVAAVALTISEGIPDHIEDGVENGLRSHFKVVNGHLWDMCDVPVHVPAFRWQRMLLREPQLVPLWRDEATGDGRRNASWTSGLDRPRRCAAQGSA